MTISPQKPKKLVGIFLLGSMHINLPPKEWANVHVSCPYRWDDEIEVFAYRTHAHSNGKVITGKDPRTKTGWSRTERFGPGPTTGPAQENFRNLGPVRTRAERNLEIPDQLGPGPREF